MPRVRRQAPWAISGTLGLIGSISVACQPSKPAESSPPPPQAAAPATQPPPNPRPATPAPVRADGAAELVAALSPEARKELEAARVPVLVPSDRALAAAAMVTTGEHWSAVSIRQGELTIAIHGSDLSRPLAAGEQIPKPTERVRGVPAILGRNVGILSVSWEENGIAYSLDVECFRPFEDPRCTENSYARSLVESLVRLEPESR